MRTDPPSPNPHRPPSPWRWLYPELERFADANEAERLLEGYHVFRTRHVVGIIIAVLLVSAVGVLGITIPFEHHRGIPFWSMAAPGVIIETAGVVAALEWIRFRRSRRYLREQLQVRGVPICIACGYDLRGLTEPRCPECGTAFDPRLLTKSDEGLKQT